LLIAQILYYTKVLNFVHPSFLQAKLLQKSQADWIGLH
jgi:hypothetical protein